MRIRKKTWARPELDVCPFFIKDAENSKNKWQSYFSSSAPLYLELGCGKSPFLAQMGVIHPDINFIGVDISMDILGVARRNIAASYEEAGKDITNMLLTCFNIQMIENIMGEEDKAERIYINFCNPWPKARHKKRRLTYPTFLKKYREILTEGGEIWFKTDDDELFEESLEYFEEAGYELLRKTYDLHKENDWPENVLTEHEIMFSSKGIPIKGAIYKKK